MGLVGLMGGMGIRDGKRGDRIFNRLGKMFFRTGKEKGPGNRRKKRAAKALFSLLHPRGCPFLRETYLLGSDLDGWNVLRRK